MTRTSELLMAARRATNSSEAYGAYMDGGEAGLATLIANNAVNSPSPTELILNDSMRHGSSRTKAIVLSDFTPSSELSDDSRRYIDSYIPDSYSISESPAEPVSELQSIFTEPDTGLAIASLIEDTSVDRETITELVELSALSEFDRVFEAVMSDQPDTVVNLIYPTDYHPRVLRHADVPDDPTMLINGGLSRERCSTCGNWIHEVYSSQRDEIITVDSQFNEEEIIDVSESERHIQVDGTESICGQCSSTTSDITSQGLDIIFDMAMLDGRDESLLVHICGYSPVLALGEETDDIEEATARIEDAGSGYVAQLPRHIDNAIRHGTDGFDACGMSFDDTGPIIDTTWDAAGLPEMKGALRESDESAVIICANNRISVGYEKTVPSAQLAKEEIPAMI